MLGLDKFVHPDGASQGWRGHLVNHPHRTRSADNRAYDALPAAA